MGFSAAVAGVSTHVKAAATTSILASLTPSTRNIKTVKTVDSGRSCTLRIQYEYEDSANGNRGYASTRVSGYGSHSGKHHQRQEAL
jgi:hypothetical protein